MVDLYSVKDISYSHSKRRKEKRRYNQKNLQQAKHMFESRVESNLWDKEEDQGKKTHYGTLIKNNISKTET